jgi:hypothetical protein
LRKNVFIEGNGIIHKLLKSIVVLACAVLVAGCSLPAPRVTVEPVVFNHPNEVIKGIGNAEGYWALADRRVFAVMGFLNAMGHDEEAPNKEMHPVRVKVRENVANNLANHPEKLQAWRKYYKDRIMGAWQYTNFGLSLSSDYPFRRIRPDKELSYAWTSYLLADFPDVLNDFWITAKLEEVWARCLPDYIAELGRCDVNETSRGITFVWQYLRMQRKDTYIIIRVPNLLERYHTANANRFEQYFYSVEGPGSGGYIHEYLHTFVKDLVNANYASQKSKLQKYFEAGKDAAISSSYQKPALWVEECLVHAIDHRIMALRTSDLSFRKWVESNVDALTQGGYTLLKPLYVLLVDFEKSDMPFDRYLPVMLERLPEYSPRISYGGALVSANTFGQGS